MRIYSHAYVRWADDCRQMCVEVALENGVPIGGVEIDVEIDETKNG